MTAVVEPLSADLADPPRSRRRLTRQLAAIARHPSGRWGLVILSALVLVAVVGAFRPYGPNEINPDAVLNSVDGRYWFGTDQTGRDQFARVAAAIPIAFAVPLLAVLLGLLVGSTIGVVAAYAGGVVERVLMWVTDLFLAMPPLLLAVVISGVFGAGMRNTVLAIGLIFVPRFARIARSSTLSVRHLPYVDAARLAGTRPGRLVLRHVLPGLVPGLVVMTTLSLSTALLAQASLSFLGMGVVPPQADLGNMLAAATSFITLAPWLVVFPVLAIVFLILGFNLLGDAVRDVIDPRVDRMRNAAAL
jgi:ABC-type dipeptide/oligopeptide/nickel transport system permease subunit